MDLITLVIFVTFLNLSPPFWMCNIQLQRITAPSPTCLFFIHFCVVVGFAGDFGSSVILLKRKWNKLLLILLWARDIRRLRVVPHFSSGIVEWAKRERGWKSPHARKGDVRWGERKMRGYRLSPSFWTNALLSQRKTLTGYSMEICQHLSKTHQPLSTLDIITIYRTNN